MQPIDGVEESIGDASERMGKSVQVFQREIENIRTGRATPALLNGLAIEYYGSSVPLNQLATIVAPDARLLTVQPWDKGSISTIEKEILKSDLGFTPQNDGVIIRLPIPPLTEERRRDLVKRLKKEMEDKHVAIRNIRRDCLEQLRKFEKQGEISEDELRRSQARLQELTDANVAEVDRIGRGKESDLMEV